MAEVNWTFQALEDVEEIAANIAQSSERYATHLVDEFFAAVDHLEQFPNAGRKVPETNLSSIRELIVLKYRIIYSLPKSNRVDILAVRHSSFPLKGIDE
jgi:toxin ParE1/3/4